MKAQISNGADANYLQELITEAQNRQGGLMLNLNDQPAAVVLTIDRYNQLVGKQAETMAVPKPKSQAQEKGTMLVAGGAGYIGAHAVRELLKAGYQVIVFDNLSSGKRENIAAGARFIEGDLADVNLLKDVFAGQRISAVMHFAASIEVEESVAFPQKYFDNNVINTARLLAVMAEAGVKKIIFSSTAAVYGDQSQMPIAETARLQPQNPYGHTKLLCERIIKYYSQHLDFQAVTFRYFNACGCDFDGKILPTHRTHLLPIVMDAAAGLRPSLVVNGNDYPTFDGTCVRDYVHVLDIARAHVAALEAMDSLDKYQTFNIGTSRGASVCEVINKASEVLEKIIPMEMGARRAGDVAELVADNRRITEQLGFELKYSDLETIIRTSWQQHLNSQ